MCHGTEHALSEPEKIEAAQGFSVPLRSYFLVDILKCLVSSIFITNLQRKDAYYTFESTDSPSESFFGAPSLCPQLIRVHIEFTWGAEV